ncbi:flagellar basal body-associated FliL family protein [Bacillus sp. BRMEA1]|uniref:flagellar basal body-associated FliL family protein n=1 Tax=Neobacillus endophyticus TaxID=2738405 RepID=UPI00156486CF|nr:flagellar basal body-associated FliL family protein [Neobacillus endophyticus]NRD79364.1 flagellar basal body-associated FliL family protein [Neobacillus endophyticus]
MKAKLKPMIIIVGVVILLLGGTAFFLFQSKSKGKTATLSADAIAANMVTTNPIVTDLTSGGFVQITFQIQTDSTKAKDELTKRDFQVREIAIRQMSGMTQDQVKSPAGMEKLETDMKTEINKLMQNGKVVQIYTTNKMIQ